MPRKYSDEQIGFALRPAEAGTPVEAICRKLWGGGGHLLPLAQDVRRLGVVTCPPRTGPDPVRGFGPVRRESAWRGSGTRRSRSSARGGRTAACGWTRRSAARSGSARTGGGRRWWPTRRGTPPSARRARRELSAPGAPVPGGHARADRAGRLGASGLSGPRPTAPPAAAPRPGGDGRPRPDRPDHRPGPPRRPVRLPAHPGPAAGRGRAGEPHAGGAAVASGGAARAPQRPEAAATRGPGRLLHAAPRRAAEPRRVRRRRPRADAGRPGPACTASAVRSGPQRRGGTTRFIAPGSPWENGSGESCTGTLRDEGLNPEIFTTLPEAQIRIERWRREDNPVRPHRALGSRPPAPDALEIRPPHPAPWADRRGAALTERLVQRSGAGQRREPRSLPAALVAVRPQRGS